jgi:tetratricopeptide (TPR) repeat protein
MLSLSCYIQARIIKNEPGTRYFACFAWFTAALVSGLLALMTKQNAFTLPLVVILYEMMFFTGNIKKKIRNLGILLAAAVAGVAILIVKSGKPIPVLLAGIDRATTETPDISRLHYLATQMRVLVTYLRLLIFPVGQQLTYNYRVSTGFLHTDVLLSGALLCILFSVAVYCLLLSQRQESRYGDAAPLFRLIAFGIFWFFITMLIESSIIPITDVIFEHRMYLPSAGLFMAVAASVSLFGGTGALVPGWPRSRVLAVTSAVLMILGLTTIARNQVWRNEISLWEDNASKSPNNVRVLTNLGHLYIWRSPDKALEFFRLALSLDPQYAEAHVGIGLIYKIHNRNDEALYEFLQAIKLKPTLYVAYDSIGLIFSRLNRNREAIEYFGKAIEFNPDDVGAYVNRGQVLLATGRSSEAIIDFRRALMIDPANATAAAQLRWLTGGR